MKTSLDCIPCFIDQTLRTARTITNNEKLIKSLLDDVGQMIKEFSLDTTPPEIAYTIYQKINHKTGINDPYKKIKNKNIKEALSLYPTLKKIVENSDNRLLTAIRIAIAGNIIDFGANKKFNIAEDVKKSIQQDFAILDYDKFTQQLDKADKIVYLGDNAGESVFDKILIEELGKKVIYVVREDPIINDVTLEDAIASGLDKVSEIISSGCSAPATIINLCNNNFLSIFQNSGLIISKGQGNYEGLSDIKEPVFFLLKAKCPVIARDLNVKQGDIILKKGNHFENHN
jgi:damage-control phosphatase, subfamily I